MTPSVNLTNGLEILEPFLKSYGFVFDKFETEKEHGGWYTTATYSNGSKRFNVGYGYSIGGLYYQFRDFAVAHEYYMNFLGFGDKKQFPSFQSDDKLLGFRCIVHDLEFLVDDFFAGSCYSLIEASKWQFKSITEQNKRAQEEFDKEPDKRTIHMARNMFKEKQYRKTLEIYAEVKFKGLLSETDKKIISYCKNQL